jgi:hypothetical protein
VLEREVVVAAMVVVRWWEYAGCCGDGVRRVAEERRTGGGRGLKRKREYEGDSESRSGGRRRVEAWYAGWLFGAVTTRWAFGGGLGG